MTVLIVNVNRNINKVVKKRRALPGIMSKEINLVISMSKIKKKKTKGIYPKECQMGMS